MARGGMYESAYSDTYNTADLFALPSNQTVGFARGGVRIAGKNRFYIPTSGWNYPSGLNGDGVWTARNMVSSTTGASARTSICIGSMPVEL
ncbi:MAG: hypothetical protein WDN00_18910 [Limisphaerales bacterium]